MSHGQAIEDVIKLKLKKPKKWNWELSTSKSSPNIVFPRIMLYDSNGNLIANAKQSNCIINENTKVKCKSKNNFELNDRKALDNVAQVIKQTPRAPINSVVVNSIPKSTDGDSKRNSGSPRNDIRMTNNTETFKKVNFNLYLKIDQSPAYLLPRKYSLSKVNVKEVHRNVNCYDLKKSKSVTDLIRRSNSYIREKRKCKRANSIEPSRFSGSILERMSALRSHLSSPELIELETKELECRPKYYFRSCNAGTLVITEESFRYQKRRRRPRTSIKNTTSKSNINTITENLLKLNLNNNGKRSTYNYNQIYEQQLNESICKHMSMSSGNKSTNCDNLSTKSENNNILNCTLKNKTPRKVVAIRKCKTSQNLALSSSDDGPLSTRQHHQFSKGFKNYGF